MKHTIIFVTSVFESVDTGPGIYARYLWNHYSDSDEFDFHMVVPESKIKHPCLHISGKGINSIDLYRKLQKKALSVANCLGEDTIIHGNAAHSMWMFLNYSGSLVVQINDYEVAKLWSHVAEIIEQSGAKRLLTLAWRHWHEQKVAKRANIVVCNSKYTHAIVSESYDLDPKQCNIIYKAVDVDIFLCPSSLPDDPLPLLARGSRIIFVGTDWERKGLDVLINVLSRINKDYPEFNLIVIGPKERGINHTMLDISKKLGIHNNVFFVGAVSRSELPNYFWHSDIAVLPSRREALGVFILEAMTAGLPVIASRTGGIPEIIDDKKYGVFM